MNILKRNLAFVLVLALALGMMVTASAANVEDYKDANDIKFVEAVDVMTALGILEGEDGVFNPQNTLTREQGAKIIAYLMLGKDAAENLGNGTAPFADVAAGRWSAGFVAYCKSQGIIGGYGNGNFGPNDPLTGTAFAKMLLVALGYGAKDEFTGPNWEIETNKQALVSGIYAGNLGTNFSGEVKREEAALYAFNTLANTMSVKYSAVFGDYYSGPSVVAPTTTFDEEETLGYKLYNLKKGNTEPDAFGRVGAAWVQGAKVLTEAYSTDATVTYTAEFTNGTLYKDLGLTRALDLGNGDDVTYWVNGVEYDETDTDFLPVKNGKIKSTEDMGTTDGGLNVSDAIGNGTTVEVYLEETSAGKYNLNIVAVSTYVAMVEKYSSKDTTVTLKAVTGGTWDSSASPKTFKTSTEYKKNDIVLYTVAGTKIQSVKLAPVVRGKLESVALTGDQPYVRFGGEKVNASANDQLVKPDNFKNTYDLVTDDYGYAIYLNKVEEAEEATVGYVYLTKTQGDTANLTNGNAAYAEVEYLDGTGTEVLPLATAKKGSTVCFNLIGVTKAQALKNNANTEIVAADKAVETNWVNISVLGDGKSDSALKDFYAYYINDDGELVLKTLAAAFEGKTDSKATVYTGAVTTEGKTTGKIATSPETELRLNSNSVVHVVKGETLTTYTGYKNINFSVSATETVSLVITDGSTNLVKEAFVIGEVKTESDKVYAVYTGNKEAVDGGTQIELWVDGETEAYVLNTNASSPAVTDPTAITTKGTVYSITVNNKNQVTMVPVTDSSITADKAGKVGAAETQYVTLSTGDTGTYYYADDVVVYDVTGDTVESGTVAVDNTITLILDKNDQVSVVFITKTK